MNTEFRRMVDESEDAYIYRICAMKDQQGIIDSWYDVRDILNESLMKNYTESAYRKKYQYFKKIFNANMDMLADSEAILTDIKESQRQLEFEKVKLRDERVALNKSYRDISRNDDMLRLLEDKISEISTKRYGVPETLTTSNKTLVNTNNSTLFVCLSDLHIGAENSNNFGAFNTEIAKKRLDKYLGEISKIRQRHRPSHCVVALMGDLINSNIHQTIRVTNRENVVEQIIEVSNMISDFIFGLSIYFDDLRVCDVPGNHTRLGKKDESLRDERLDDLIPWYLKASLKFQKNIKFVDEKYDPTIASVTISGKEYWIVHGDFDSFSKQGITDLVMLIGHIPEGIFFGHRHTCSYDDISGVKIIRSGSLSSPSDDYCISKRIKGHASQMVCICDRDGIQTLYPVDLEDKRTYTPSEISTFPIEQATKYTNFAKFAEVNIPSNTTTG